MAAGAKARALGSLAVLAAAVTWGHHCGQGLTPLRHPDTPSYLLLLEPQALEDVLAHYRTFGYPLFLRAVGALGLPWEAIAAAQLAVYLGAVLLFWGAVHAYSRRPWLAFASSAPLLFAPVFDLVRFVQPDYLSSALAIVAFASLLFVVARPRSAIAWSGVGLATLLAYHVRPATVFLIALVPALAAALWRLRDGRPWRWIAWRAIALAAVTVLPWLAYATLRAVEVEHFGLVGFGGYNASALAACFVDEELIAELPPWEARLASKIFSRRRARGWEPVRLGEATLPCFEQYSDNLWRICSAVVWDELRAARSHRRQRLAAGDPIPAMEAPERIVVNRRLTRFARAVIGARPALYGQWVRDAIGYGLAQLPAEPWIRWPSLLLAASLPALGWVGRGRDLGASLAASGGREASALALAAGAWFAAFLFLTCLVSYPFLRYFQAMILFLPSALLTALFVVWSAILTLRRTEVRR